MTPNLNSIKDIFSKIELQNWDLSNSLKWGFFFISSEEVHLHKVFSELVDYEYKIINIHLNEGSEWVMQVSKIEKLEPEKLYHRCIAFNELAEAYDCYYDGWDVEQSV